ncbi:MAG: CoB--CoM heterodisulfide reductase iron-sulfur subunit B family protein [candidate division Zixibacteria bacterium]|nr:CoB--CoM heterodisulfide reductase iron-sulfur subunit B family protein [Candidatus Tariuqbacter arcticus]
MMEYAYYPGCSLENTGKPYDWSIREVFKTLSIGLREIEDWNCCGATMYMSVDKIVGFAVSARNLALAQNMGLDICAPCSSCYTTLRKTNRHMTWNIHSRKLINEALKAGGLSYDKMVEVRHPLDILVNDVGIEKISASCRFELEGLKVAPYYGCMIVRPVYDFDDMDDPQTMDMLFDALGADVVDYPDKVRCCGGMLMTTFEEIALNLNNHLLKCAEDNGADVIVTTCPLCQMNLESYQAQINRRYNLKHNMPIMYFSQLVGLALGVEPSKLGIDTLLIEAPKIKLKPKAVEAAV